MRTITISEEAADCLAWWGDHEMYGDSLSEVIIQQMEEWLSREHGFRPVPKISETSIPGSFQTMLADHPERNC